MKRLAFLFAFAAPAFAQSIATSATHVVVAHDRVIEVWKTGALTTATAKGDGVDTPGAIAISDTHAAVADQVHNRVAIVDLATGRSAVAKTQESPVAVAFAGRDLLVLDHDASAIERISPDGAATLLPLALDPAMLAVEGDHAYVCSRVSGVLQEITLSPFAVARTLNVPPFPSSMVLKDGVAYLTYPHEGKVRVFELPKMVAGDELRLGAFPVDITFASEATPLTARQLAVADAASKRIWVIEAQQSTSKAVLRGFLRGLIGLGLYQGKSAAFPTGIDRVAATNGKYVAFDSSTGTLYEVTKKESRQLAEGLGPRAFAVTPDEKVVWWQNGTLVAQKLD